MPRNELPPIVIMAIMMAGLVGCESHDQRLADLARQSAERQAQQNQELAQLNREVAAGTKRLVEAGAEATDKVLTMEHDLQQQRSQLESERRSLAQERAHESLLGPLISTAGMVFVCSLPLILCWYLLYGLSQDQQETAINELLVEELVGDDRPALLPPSRSQEALGASASSANGDEARSADPS